ncbi:MAG: hypothetical protein GF346_06930 [Candidatus Eisenbacteria bacterium]|nr:hypothetical protein [Candidatus Latescibacterota bacterium]MBD3302163.1 hypothetical protein [Candidatus Eisenbacteria bacterium]
MRIRGRLKGRPEIAQAPMSDVAFLLLIFFLSTTIFDFEVGIPMVLPGVQSTRERVEREDVLEIATAADGTITIDGLPALLDSVEETVRARLNARPELTVFLVTHPSVPYRRMVELLDEVRAARARRIMLKLGEG